LIKFWKNIKEISKNTDAPLNFPQKVLIAPLDWGLGHTTRCISIIRFLQQKSCQIFIAANKQQTILLRQELPNVTFLSLEGYNISYSRKKQHFARNIAFQVPGLLLSIFREHQWLKQKQKEYQFDLVISDNRYGIYHSKISSVFITHQLSIRSGISKKADKIINQWNRWWIKRFDECWVPDIAGPFSLAGELSHPSSIPENVKYIGPLSRFSPSHRDCGDYILVLISGPEPQRSLFEELLLDQLKTIQEKIVLIRGLPGDTSAPHNAGNIEIHNHAPTPVFEKLLSNAGMVICRSGYSSIMDLVLTGKKAILIPTPGQTEQEYLAEHLHNNEIFFTVSQSDLDLKKNLEEAKQFPFKSLSIPFDGFKNIVGDLRVKTT
jgi:uncharacterized protein (TIGR00661 family)